jgi:PPOX class probable F420-dependent enzyme
MAGRTSCRSASCCSETRCTAPSTTSRKTTTRLRRLENLRDTGSACLLVDHYDSDWSRLWWVRLDGVGRVIPDDPDPGRLAHTRMVLASLADKYEQYAATPPTGPVLAIDITVWRGWSAYGLDARP